MANNGGDYGDDFDDDFERDEECADDAVDLELVKSEVKVHRAAATAHHVEAVQQARVSQRQGQEYNKWGARGSQMMRPGKKHTAIDAVVEESKTKPGPGQYKSTSSINVNKAIRFTRGVRIERRIDDEEGGYIDPLNSSTLTKQGAIISPGGNARHFMSWDEEGVGQWLERVGLGHLAKKFIRQKVQGQDLYEKKPEDIRDFLSVDAFADRRRLTKEISVLKGGLSKGGGCDNLPNLGPGRYNTSTAEIYRLTKKNTAIGGAMGKGGPMPIYEDYVQLEALTKPAPNTYSHVNERYQHFMSQSLDKAVKFSTGEPLTAIERRCRQIEDDPAPGDYCIPAPQPRNKGSKISKSKRKDLWGTFDNVPGPGSYQCLDLHTIRYVVLLSFTTSTFTHPHMQLFLLAHSPSQNWLCTVWYCVDREEVGNRQR